MWLFRAEYEEAEISFIVEASGAAFVPLLRGEKRLERLFRQPGPVPESLWRRAQSRIRKEGAEEKGGRTREEGRADQVEAEAERGQGSRSHPTDWH